MVRKHIYFSGRVQGVGFRYQAVWMAKSVGLTGWVRNLMDGRVEMEIQGKEAVIQEMLASLEKDSYIRIDEMEICDMAVDEKERKFRTRFTY